MVLSALECLVSLGVVVAIVVTVLSHALAGLVLTGSYSVVADAVAELTIVGIGSQRVDDPVTWLAAFVVVGVFLPVFEVPRLARSDPREPDPGRRRWAIVCQFRNSTVVRLRYTAIAVLYASYATGRTDCSQRSDEYRVTGGRSRTVHWFLGDPAIRFDALERRRRSGSTVRGTRSLEWEIRANEPR